MGMASLQMADLDISLCVLITGWSLLWCLNKINNWMGGLPIPSKPWEGGTAFGANHLPLVGEAPHMLREKYEGPNICLGQTLYTHNKTHDIY